MPKSTIDELRDMIDVAIAEVERNIKPLHEERDLLNKARIAISDLSLPDTKAALISCPTCGKVFAPRAIKLHQYQAHPTTPPVFCPECGKSGATKANLALHRRMSHGIIPVKVASS